MISRLNCSVLPTTCTISSIESKWSTNTESHISKEIHCAVAQSALPIHYSARHHSHIASDAKIMRLSGCWCQDACISSAAHKMYHTLSHGRNLRASLGPNVVRRIAHMCALHRDTPDSKLRSPKVMNNRSMPFSIEEFFLYLGWDTQ